MITLHATGNSGLGGQYPADQQLEQDLLKPFQGLHRGKVVLALHKIVTNHQNLRVGKHYVSECFQVSKFLNIVLCAPFKRQFTLLLSQEQLSPMNMKFRWLLETSLNVLEMLKLLIAVQQLPVLYIQAEKFRNSFRDHLIKYGQSDGVASLHC